MKDTCKMYTQEEYDALKAYNEELHSELQQFINCVVRNTIKMNNTFNNGKYQSKPIIEMLDSLTDYACSHYHNYHKFNLYKLLKRK